MRSVCLGDYELPTKERARQALNAFLKNKLPASRQEGVGVGLVSRSIYRIVVLAAKRAGITGISPHTLRHSCATHLLNRGVDIRFVQELLGHCNLGATQKYLHVAIERLQKVHELLERG
jgi:site-specific recombinase XerD